VMLVTDILPPKPQNGLTTTTAGSLVVYEETSMMTNAKRDCRAYYATCPEDSDHFILIDPRDPCWQKTRSPNPEKILCPVCGPNHEVRITAGWRKGYVSQDELDKGFTLDKPSEAPETAAENAEATCP
jgi:hypothetical protein